MEERILGKDEAGSSILPGGTILHARQRVSCLNEEMEKTVPDRHAHMEDNEMTTLEITSPR